MEETMKEIRPIHYDGELLSLVNLIKSNSLEGNMVIEVLQTGDEALIRQMLANFGNPESIQWHNVTLASPWSQWQIDQAVEDLKSIKPPELATARFWAW
jgi:hypothetical protein